MLDRAEPLRAGSGTIAALDGKGELRPFVEIEADLIRFALAHHRGRMALVARKLGIGRSTLYRKLKELNLAETEGIAAE
jgi:DNA-binding NtrC family response regulator